MRMLMRLYAIVACSRRLRGSCWVTWSAVSTRRNCCGRPLSVSSWLDERVRFVTVWRRVGHKLSSSHWNSIPSNPRLICSCFGTSGVDTLEQLLQVADLEGAWAGFALPPPLGDGLAVLIDMWQRYCILVTPSPVYLFKHVKRGTQNIQNDCHQWLCDSFLVYQIRFRRGLRPGRRGGTENAGADRRGGKCRSGKCRSDNAWKSVRRDSIRYQYLS